MCDLMQKKKKTFENPAFLYEAIHKRVGKCLKNAIILNYFTSNNIANFREKIIYGK